MNWHGKPYKAEVKQEICGDRPGYAYDIGSYSVTVFEDGKVEYSDRRETGSPSETLPNMDIRDGEIRILVSDLVGEALKRLEPEDLARSLWQHKEVRSAFMDCLIRRYNEEGIGDDERRTFLEGVKKAIHSRALDELSKHMASQEYAASKRAFFYHEVNQINDRLRHFECTDGNGEIIQLRHEDNDPDFKISGTHWNDARAFWRDEVLKRFPALPQRDGDRTASPNDQRCLNQGDSNGE